MVGRTVYANSRLAFGLAKPQIRKGIQREARIMNSAVKHILNKYKLKKNKSQYRLYCSREGSLSVIFKELGFNLGAVIGVETGRFSKCLCTINHNLKLYAVDMWGESEVLYDKAKARLAPFNCQIIRDVSMNAVKRLADGSLDFVYLSTFHDLKNAMNDIKEWSKKVRKGGIVAGQDYNIGSNGKPSGVKLAVNKWVKKNKIKPLFVFEKNDSPTWFYVKGGK